MITWIPYRGYGTMEQHEKHLFIVYYESIKREPKIRKNTPKRKFHTEKVLDFFFYEA
jgi:hypothetical protein